MPATLIDLRNEALRVAMTQEGVIERGGPNKGPEVEKYLKTVGLGPGHPWCAAFVCWCYQQAMQNLKMRRAPPFRFSGRVLTMWKTAPTQWKSATPTVGAIYCHFTDINDPDSTGHCGIVTRIDNEFQDIFGIEGNTNSYGSRIGDRVRINRRDWSYVNGGYLDIGREGPAESVALQS